ncbi:TRAP transporter small permease [Oceanobacillus senegalensis]|uniref:TRAP transporter small permease n=1 Tax=Oceanobacillus senegalensis TaxID=1936063 RepID=UPI000A30F523|nr:TRAP transporter small permease [Oceanobacillus senegalensis]
MKRFVQMLDKVQMIFGAIFLCIFFLVVIFQIATRHLGIPVIWTEEVANYSFIWAILMGASVMVNRREHFNFDLLQKKLKGGKGAVLQIVIDLILIVFNIAIFLLGIQVVNEFWNYTWASLPEMKMGYVWIAIPIMAGTMIIYSLSHLLDHMKALKTREVTD